MTFKGMLKIVMDDYKKQHEAKMFSIVNELLQARRELSQVKEQLRILQMDRSLTSSKTLSNPVPTISLFVQYNGVFNQLCDFRLTMTIKELLIKLRQITGISLEHPIRVCVLSEDDLSILFILDKELDRTIESYDEEFKPRMILSIENDGRKTHFQRSKSIRNSEQTHSYGSDV